MVLEELRREFENIKVLLERTQRELDERGKDIKETVALNEKVTRLQRQYRNYEDAITSGENRLHAENLERELGKTKVGAYLLKKDFKKIDRLDSIKNNDWVSYPFWDYTALIIHIPRANIEEAGRCWSETTYWSQEDHEHKTTTREWSTYNKVDVKGTALYLVLGEKEIRIRTGLELTIFDPCSLKYDPDNQRYIYDKLNLGNVVVSLKKNNVPYFHLLRHENIEIEDMLKLLKHNEG